MGPYNRALCYAATIGRAPGRNDMVFALQAWRLRVQIGRCGATAWYVRRPLGLCPEERGCRVRIGSRRMRLI